MDAIGTGGAADFDFLIGRWAIRNERLRQRFAGGADWDVFDATSECRTVLGGAGNLEEMEIPERNLSGLTLRLFDPAAGMWSLNWADSRSRRVFPPVVGGFAEGRGVFHGEDIDDGRPVRVRFLWTPSASAPLWEQAFSVDGGATWEANWVMRFSRLG